MSVKGGRISSTHRQASDCGHDSTACVHQHFRIPECMNGAERVREDIQLRTRNCHRGTNVFFNWLVFFANCGFFKSLSPAWMVSSKLRSNCVSLCAVENATKFKFYMTCGGPLRAKEMRRKKQKMLRMTLCEGYVELTSFAKQIY